MISKMPRWIEYGAFLLAALAGIVNAIGILGFQHQSVSHVSGNATLFGLALYNGSDSALQLVILLCSFIAGASISGVLIESSSLKLGRNYSSALIVECVLILVALFVLKLESVIGYYLISAACGLQNALITTYSGAIIRTTHLTGVFTDLGLLIGQRLRGNELDSRRALLYLLIISGFIFGGITGGFLFSIYEYDSLFVPAIIALSLSISYAVYSKKELIH